MVVGPKSDEPDQIKLYDDFICAQTCMQTISSFAALCKGLNMEYPTSYQSNAHATFYEGLKKKLPPHWQCKELWAKIDKRYYCKEYFVSSRGADYRKGPRACESLKALVIGGGPVGMRTAIEMAFLGAKVVVVEKRDKFSRNNVLHLWPFLITDLKQLGAKKFYGRFCSGALDHVSIRQLQLILLKTALIVGVEFHVGVSYNKLIPPVNDGVTKKGWSASISPDDHIVNDFEFDLVVGADARRNTFEGFPKRELRGKLAIGLTCNFINLKSAAEVQVEEISGVAYHFNQQFFQKLSKNHGIDLENIVYYKGDTHYFVMCAKKPSLLRRGVLINDLENTDKLVSPGNVSKEQLREFLKLAADCATKGQMPHLQFAENTYGKDDVALFDFTRMYRAENASRFEEQNGYKLLLALVGDSLIEPFWPMGTGCARGFLAGFDTAWMARRWWLKTAEKAKKGTIATDDNLIELDVLAERETVYRLLQQSTPQLTSSTYSQYTIDPQTRYLNMSKTRLSRREVSQLYTSDRQMITDYDVTDDAAVAPRKIPSTVTDLSSLTRKASLLHDNNLLAWCKKSIRGYSEYIVIFNMTSSWRSGVALCVLIHAFRPTLIELDLLDKLDAQTNNQLAFDIAEKHLGIAPKKTGKEMAEEDKVDQLFMYSYISQFYELFKNETPTPPAARQKKAISRQPTMAKIEDEMEVESPPPPPSKSKSSSKMGFFSKLVNGARSKRRSSSHDGSDDDQVKKRRGAGLFGKKKSYDLHKAADKPTNEPEALRISKLEDDRSSTTTSSSSSSSTVEKQATTQLQPLPKLTRHNSLRMPSGSKMSSLSRTGSCRVNQRASNRISMLSEHLMQQFNGNLPANAGLDAPSKTRDELSAIKGSGKCYFCQDKVYIMERHSAEGHFFHRKCFVCRYCSEPLRRRHYYDQKTGHFYCNSHADMAGQNETTTTTNKEETKDEVIKKNNKDEQAVEVKISPKSTSQEQRQLPINEVSCGDFGGLLFEPIPEEDPGTLEMVKEDPLLELSEEILMERNHLSLSRRDNHQLDESMSDTSDDDDDMFDDDYAALLNNQLQNNGQDDDEEDKYEDMSSNDDGSNSSGSGEESVFGTTSDENAELSDCSEKPNGGYSPLVESPLESPLDDHTVDLLNKFTHVLETDEAESEKDRIVIPPHRHSTAAVDLITFDDEEMTTDQTTTEGTLKVDQQQPTDISSELVKAFATPPPHAPTNGARDELVDSDTSMFASRRLDDDDDDSFDLNIKIKQSLEDRRTNRMKEKPPTAKGVRRSSSDTATRPDNLITVKAYGGLFTDETSIWSNLPEDDTREENLTATQQNDETRNGTTTIIRHSIKRHNSCDDKQRQERQNNRKSYKSPLESVELRMRFRLNSGCGSFDEVPAAQKEETTKRNSQLERKLSISSVDAPTDDDLAGMMASPPPYEHVYDDDDEIDEFFTPMGKTPKPRSRRQHEATADDSMYTTPQQETLYSSIKSTNTGTSAPPSAPTRNHQPPTQGRQLPVPAPRGKKPRALPELPKIPHLEAYSPTTSRESTIEFANESGNSRKRSESVESLRGKFVTMRKKRSNAINVDESAPQEGDGDNSMIVYSGRSPKPQKKGSFRMSLMRKKKKKTTTIQLDEDVVDSDEHHMQQFSRKVEAIPVHKKNPKKKRLLPDPEMVTEVRHQLQESSTPPKQQVAPKNRKDKKHYSAVEKKVRFRQKKKRMSPAFDSSKSLKVDDFMDDEQVRKVSETCPTDQSELERAILRGEVIRKLPQLPTQEEHRHHQQQQHRSQKRSQGDMDAKLRKRALTAAKKQARFEEQRKFQKAQIIQQQLDEVEMKYKELEDHGVQVEKIIRGETQAPPDEDDSRYLAEWIHIVQQKNQLIMLEKELLSHQRELQLKDQQLQIEEEIRNLPKNQDGSKPLEIAAAEEKLITKLMQVVEQRNEIVMYLDEQRQLQDSIDPVALMISKFDEGLNLHDHNNSSIMTSPSSSAVATDTEHFNTSATSSMY